MMATRDCYYEPIELRRLKAKLASITCNCNSCDRKNCLVPPDVQLNQQVQVGEPQRKINSYDRFTQATAETIDRDQTALINTLTKDILCPSCFITMNLLRGGALKVLKDQESETVQDMFTCDKCIGKCTKLVERSTSHTAPCILSNNIPVCDDCVSDDDTFSQSSICQPDRHHSHQVKFDDNNIENIMRTSNGGCMCMDDFIESIRPPLRECVFTRRRR